MKFLCGNCKAKYQIPDEKVVGRTLRMKCRRCNHDILIDGHAMPAASSTPSQPARRQGGSSVSVIPGPVRGGSGVGPLPSHRPVPPPAPGLLRSKPPSALGADFRRHVAAPPAVPARSAPYDLWHVAIQDVPVGPMTRDELARKIEAGAVVATSLCWREGMDDWRPIGDLPELAALMRRSMLPAAPPNVRGSMRPPQGRMPPAVPGAGGSRAPAVYDYEDVEEDGSEPTRVADMTGGQPAVSPAAAARIGGAASQPRMPAIAAAPAFAPAPAAAVEPSPRAATQRPGQNPYAMMAVGLALGVLLFGGPMIIRQMWFTQPTAPTVQGAAIGAASTTKTEDRATRDVNVDVPNNDPGEEVEGKTGQAKSPGKPGAQRITKTNQDKPTEEKPDDKLSAAERALLERMGGGSDDKLAEIGRKPQSGTNAGGGGSGPALTANQLMKVVQDNRPALQRCYETALRSSGGKTDDAIKVSVEVVVGMSGTVKSVDTRGPGLGNMNDCIKQSVKRWRFPQSGDESPFNFPVVFQPGG